MTYGNMVMILLYRVIGRIGMMTLHLEIANEESDMDGRTWDHSCDVSAMISCPQDLGGGICAQLCIYAFGIIWIVVYDVGGCHMSVVINLGEVDCVCSCVMDFMMFLAYFWDNNHDITTVLSGLVYSSTSCTSLLTRVSCHMECHHFGFLTCTLSKLH